jgi:uncharacterized OB-fold protein
MTDIVEELEFPDLAVPEPDEISRFFWDGAQKGQLLIQQCQACQRWLFPPGPTCPRCGSRSLEPREVTGRGTVYTFAIVNRVLNLAYANRLPYTVAMVELDDAPGARLLSNIPGTHPSEVFVGMPVEVMFEPRGDIALPQFRSSNGSGE